MMGGYREDFTNRLLDGKHYEHLLAERFRAAGLEVEESTPYLDDTGLADLGESAHSQWINDFDLTVAGEWIEVKSKRQEFTSPADFPFPDAIICAVKAWDEKAEAGKLPLAFVLVSQAVEGFVVIPTRYREHWWIDIVHDQRRGTKYPAFHAAATRMTTLEALERHLTKRAGLASG